MPADVCERCGGGPVTVQTAVADAVSACDALLATMPQPRVSAGDAMRDLTDAQRGVLLQSRAETLRAVRTETAALQERLDALTAQAHTYRNEFTALMNRPHHPRMQQIAKWFEDNDDEVGVLKVAIAELGDFASRLEALRDPAADVRTEVPPTVG